MPTTTVKSLTEAQISRLRDEARDAGDDAMVAICIVAQDGTFISHDWTLTLTRADERRIGAMSQDDAYAAIVRAINAAEAQADEIRDDDDCNICEVTARKLTCERCGTSARITDCGHHSQPRPIAGGDADGHQGHKTYCADCAEVAAIERRRNE